MEETISAIQAMALVLLAALSMDMIRRFIGNHIERNGYPLPPGPTPLPFLGSALSVNIREPFKTYTKWWPKYGDMMYVRILDMDIVVLHTLSVATALLEKRSQLYSSRPFIATVDPYGHDFDFAFAQYGDSWRMCRRIFHQTFRADVTANFHPTQLRKARQMILNVIESPIDYKSHYMTFAAAVTMCTIYDYEPSPRNDEMVSVINNFIKASLPALTAEKAVLLKTFPFLLHMPDWFPGSWIKREARAAREWGAKVVEAPYQWALKRLEAKEDVNPSMISSQMTNMEKFDDSYRLVYEEALKRTCSTAFIGSVETTSSIITTFTLAMVKNPHVCKRAQTEIDTIVGTHRLPEFDDRSSLPYVDAILRETLRWQPPVPLVIHSAISSDVYNGFYIPNGAAVVANVWGMTRDEARYPDAEKFIPERFLDADGMLTDDKVEYIFGFGRRICPGRHTANASLWIAMVTMLATLDFSLAQDADGNDILFEVKFMNGAARHPLTFPCRITPRAHISKASLEQVLSKC